MEVSVLVLFVGYLGERLVRGGSCKIRWWFWEMVKLKWAEGTKLSDNQLQCQRYNKTPVSIHRVYWLNETNKSIKRQEYRLAGTNRVLMIHIIHDPSALDQLIVPPHGNSKNNTTSYVRITGSRRRWNFTRIIFGTTPHANLKKKTDQFFTRSFSFWIYLELTTSTILEHYYINFKTKK